MPVINLLPFSSKPALLFVCSMMMEPDSQSGPPPDGTMLNFVRSWHCGDIEEEGVSPAESAVLL